MTTTCKIQKIGSCFHQDWQLNTLPILRIIKKIIRGVTNVTLSLPTWLSPTYVISNLFLYTDLLKQQSKSSTPPHKVPCKRKQNNRHQINQGSGYDKWHLHNISADTYCNQSRSISLPSHGSDGVQVRNFL